MVDTKIGQNNQQDTSPYSQEADKNPYLQQGGPTAEGKTNRGTDNQTYSRPVDDSFVLLPLKDVYQSTPTMDSTSKLQLEAEIAFKQWEDIVKSELHEIQLGKITLNPEAIISEAESYIQQIETNLNGNINADTRELLKSHINELKIRSQALTIVYFETQKSKRSLRQHKIFGEVKHLVKNFIKQEKFDKSQYKTQFIDAINTYISYWLLNSYDVVPPYLTFDPQISRAVIYKASLNLPAEKQERFKNKAIYFLSKLTQIDHNLKNSDSNLTDILSWKDIEDTIGNSEYIKLMRYHSKTAQESQEIANSFLELFLHYIKLWKANSQNQDFRLYDHKINLKLLNATLQTYDDYRIKNKTVITYFYNFFEERSSTEQPSLDVILEQNKSNISDSIYLKYQNSALYNYLKSMFFLPSYDQLDNELPTSMKSMSIWGSPIKGSTEVHKPLSTSVIVPSFKVLRKHARSVIVNDNFGEQRTLDLDFMHFLGGVDKNIRELLQSADKNGRIKITIPAFMYEHDLDEWSLQKWAEAIEKNAFANTVLLSTRKKHKKKQQERITPKNRSRYIDLLSQTTGMDKKKAEAFLSSIIPLLPCLKRMVPIYDSLGALLSFPEESATRYKIVLVPDSGDYSSAISDAPNVIAKIHDQSYDKTINNAVSYLNALKSLGITEFANKSTLEEHLKTMDETLKLHIFYKAMLLDKGYRRSFRNGNDIKELTNFYKTLPKKIRKLYWLMSSGAIQTQDGEIRFIVSKESQENDTKLLIEPKYAIQIFSRTPKDSVLKTFQALIMLKYMALSGRIKFESTVSDNTITELQSIWPEKEISKTELERILTLLFKACPPECYSKSSSNTIKSEINADIINEWRIYADDLPYGKISAGEEIIVKYIKMIRMPKTGFWPNVLTRLFNNNKLDKDTQLAVEFYLRTISGKEILIPKSFDDITLKVWADYESLFPKRKGKLELLPEAWAFLGERITLMTFGTEFSSRNNEILILLKQMIKEQNSDPKTTKQTFKELPYDSAYNVVFEDLFSRYSKKSSVDLELVKKTDILAQATSGAHFYDPLHNHNYNFAEQDFLEGWYDFKREVTSDFTVLLNDSEFGIQAWLDKHYDYVPFATKELKFLLKQTLIQRYSSNLSPSKFIHTLYKSTFGSHEKVAIHIANCLETILAEYLEYVLFTMKKRVTNFTDFYLPESASKMKPRKHYYQIVEEALENSKLTEDELNFAEKNWRLLAPAFQQEIPTKSWRDVYEEIIADPEYIKTFEKIFKETDERHDNWLEIEARLLEFNAEIQGFAIFTQVDQEPNPEKQILILEEGAAILTGFRGTLMELSDEYDKIMLSAYDSQDEDFVESRESFVNWFGALTQRIKVLENELNGDKTKVEKELSNRKREIELKEAWAEVQDFDNNVLSLWSEEIGDLVLKLNEIKNKLNYQKSNESSLIEAGDFDKIVDEIKELIEECDDTMRLARDENLVNRADRISKTLENLSDRSIELTNEDLEFAVNNLKVIASNNRKHLERVLGSLDLLEEYRNESSQILHKIECRLIAPVMQEEHIPDFSGNGEQIETGEYNIYLDPNQDDSENYIRPLILVTPSKVYLIPETSGKKVNRWKNQNKRQQTLELVSIFGNKFSIKPNAIGVDLRTHDEMPANHPAKILAEQLQSIQAREPYTGDLFYTLATRGKRAYTLWIEITNILSTKRDDPILTLNNWMLKRYHEIRRAVGPAVSEWFYIETKPVPRKLTNDPILTPDKFNELFSQSYNHIDKSYKPIYNNWLEQLKNKIPDSELSKLKKSYPFYYTIFALANHYSEDMVDKLSNEVISGMQHNGSIDKIFYQFFLKYEIYLVGKWQYGKDFHFSWKEMSARAEYYSDLAKKATPRNCTPEQLAGLNILAQIHSQPRMFHLAYFASLSSAAYPHLADVSDLWNSFITYQAKNYIENGGVTTIHPSVFQSELTIVTEPFVLSQFPESRFTSKSTIQNWINKSNYLKPAQKQKLIGFSTKYLPLFTLLYFMNNSNIRQAQIDAKDILKQLNSENINSALISSAYYKYRDKFINNPQEIIKLAGALRPFENHFSIRSDKYLAEKYPETESIDPRIKIQAFLAIVDDNGRKSLDAVQSIYLKIPRLNNMIYIISNARDKIREGSRMIKKLHDWAIKWSKQLEISTGSSRNFDYSQCRAELEKIYADYRSEILRSFSKSNKIMFLEKELTHSQLLFGTNNPERKIEWEDLPIDQKLLLFNPEFMMTDEDIIEESWSHLEKELGETERGMIALGHKHSELKPIIVSDWISENPKTIKFYKHISKNKNSLDSSDWQDEYLELHISYEEITNRRKAIRSGSFNIFGNDQPWLTQFDSKRYRKHRGLINDSSESHLQYTDPLGTYGNVTSYMPLFLPALIGK